MQLPTLLNYSANRTPAEGDFMSETPAPSLDMRIFPLDQAWEMILDQLKAEMGGYNFASFVQGTRALELMDGVLTLSATSEYNAQWIASRLGRTIRRAIEPLLGQPVQLRVIDAAQAQPPAVAPEKNGTFRVVEQNRVESRPAEAQKPNNPPALIAPAVEILPPPGPRSRGEVVERLNEPVPAPQVIAANPGNPATGEPLANAPAIPGPTLDDETCARLVIEELADTVEAALVQPGRIVPIPRYELRHIPLVGPEAFFLRLAFLQERFLHTPREGQSQPFETTVEALLRWSNVGRATLHRFKKGDPARGQMPAAGWFGIEQLPSAPRSQDSQQQPPCRYRLQQGIPLTPMDADRLTERLLEAGIQADPLGAIQALCSRPVNELLEYPPPAPTAEQKCRAPSFNTVAGVVQAALGGQKLSPDLRARLQEAANQLADHVTAPGQLVLVSWYFLRHWLPLLGHAAAALVITTRAQGYYNPQDQELRDEIPVPGGYSQLARVIGLRRDRTIGDWLPNLFDRAESDDPGPDSDKWQREQQRQQHIQDLIGAFMDVVPGSRKKTPAGHYAFNLRVQLQSEPLTPADRTLRAWVYRSLAACLEQNVAGHFIAWVTSPVIAQLAQDGVINDSGINDGAGMLGETPDAESPRADRLVIAQNDGWGIVAARAYAGEMTARESRVLTIAGSNLAQTKMTAGESDRLDDDGWGILGHILEDGAGILARSQMTARELFKGLLRLNTYWESIRLKTTQPGRTEKTACGAKQNNPVVVTSGLLSTEFGSTEADNWNLRQICQRNGGMNSFREQIVAQEQSARPFISWLLYAYSIKGGGIIDPVGWALSRLRTEPGRLAEGVFERLSALPPAEIARLLRHQLDSGLPPQEENWRLAFRDVSLARLRALADTLSLAG